MVRLRLDAVRGHVVVARDKEGGQTVHDPLRQAPEGVPPRREPVRVGQVAGMQQHVGVVHPRDVFEHRRGDLRLAGVPDDGKHG